MRARASPGAPASARAALLPARALTRGSIRRRRRDANDTNRQVGKLAAPVGLLPFEHYSVPYCRPKEDIEAVPASLGELLTGDKLHSSAYSKIDMLRNRTCVELCTVEDFDRRVRADDSGADGSFKLFERLVRENYRVQMRMDNMPAIELRYDPLHNVTYMGLPGFPMGFVVNAKGGGDAVYVNNHIGAPARARRLARPRSRPARGGI